MEAMYSQRLGRLGFSFFGKAKSCNLRMVFLLMDLFHRCSESHRHRCENQLVAGQMGIDMDSPRCN